MNSFILCTFSAALPWRSWNCASSACFLSSYDSPELFESSSAWVGCVLSLWISCSLVWIIASNSWLFACTGVWSTIVSRYSLIKSYVSISVSRVWLNYLTPCLQQALWSLIGRNKKAWDFSYLKTHSIIKTQKVIKIQIQQIFRDARCTTSWSRATLNVSQKSRPAKDRLTSSGHASHGTATISQWEIIKTGNEILMLKGEHYRCDKQSVMIRWNHLYTFLILHLPHLLHSSFLPVLWTRTGHRKRVDTRTEYMLPLAASLCYRDPCSNCKRMQSEKARPSAALDMWNLKYDCHVIIGDLRRHRGSSKNLLFMSLIEWTVGSLQQALHSDFEQPASVVVLSSTHRLHAPCHWIVVSYVLDTCIFIYISRCLPIPSLGSNEPMTATVDGS